MSKRYNIPIVYSIGDDYYFNYNFSLSPFYHLYKLQYRKLIRKVFQQPGSAIFIGDKIRDKYNKEFGLNGETVYLTSSIERREFKPINMKKPKISFFWNIRVGRNESLDEIGHVLGKINPSYVLDVYSNEDDEKFYKLLYNNCNVKFHGSIPYAEVQKKTVESDIVIVVEGFKNRDVDITRYSLSTKVADALASGVNVFAYGSIECGAIEYTQSIQCKSVCTEQENLVSSLEKLIYNQSYQKSNYDSAICITHDHHRLEQSTRIFEGVVAKVIESLR